MPLSQLRNVNFGKSKLNATGSSGVGYQLLSETGAVQAVRTTSGVYKTAPGIYAAYISFPDYFRGQVLWDTGAAFASTFYATEQYNVEENDPRVASTYANTNYITGSVNYISSTLHAVSGNVDQINNTTTQIFGTVNNMQTQVTQMSGTLNNVYDLVFDLSGTINILSSSVTAISSSATLISSSANIIDNSVSTLSGAIASLSQITGTLASIETKTDRLIDIQYGRWFIDNNQMIFYGEDNVTEVARFDLFDDSGNPTMDAVFERVKV